LGMASAKAAPGSLTVAAPSFVFTIARVAKMLGEDEDTLYDIALTMEPEDGCLTILDIDDDASTIAFTEFGIENLKELLADSDRESTRPSY
jgi:hypothetical protein